MEALTNLCTTVVGKVLLAIVVWFVGKFIVNKILGLVGKIKVLDKIEPNTRTFVLSALKWLLYVILVVSIVAILGVPMASVITVLGTAGAAIALSLQGSLSNLAGGIMLVIFRPFKVGDFVELKNSTLGPGTKLPHLIYVGDSDVGARCNFGCGSITCNYDGNFKYRTTVGDDVFIGCNTNLVSPCQIGDGAYTAAGTTLTGPVPADTLAIGRAAPAFREGWAARHRALKEETK